MYSIRLLLALLLTWSLSLAVIPENGLAKSATSEAAVSADKGVTTGSAKTDVAEININTADEELLTQVAGVGPVMAKRIVDYRRENGNYKSLDELTNVKGIGTKTLAKMKPYLEKF